MPCFFQYVVRQVIFICADSKSRRLGCHLEKGVGYMPVQPLPVFSTHKVQAVADFKKCFDIHFHSFKLTATLNCNLTILSEYFIILVSLLGNGV